MRFELTKGRLVTDLEVSEEDLVNMDVTMAYFLRPLLERFRERTYTYPVNVESPQEWINIIDQIHEAMNLIIKNQEKENLTDWEWAKVRTGCFFLGKHFVDLWM